MNAATAATAMPGSTGVIAHVSDKPVYIAPAAHAFEIAPASHSIPLAPAGHGFVPPPEKSSGIGISADHHA
jgi:hypothetical protein